MFWVTFATSLSFLIKILFCLYLPIVLALGTGIPVMLFAYLLAFSASKVGKAFNAIRKVETMMRYVAGGIFVVIGVYYGLIFLQWI